MIDTKPTYEILKQELANNGIPFIECKNLGFKGGTTFALHISASPIFYIDEINKLKYILREFEKDLLISKMNNYDTIEIKIKNKT